MKLANATLAAAAFLALAAPALADQPNSSQTMQERQEQERRLGKDDRDRPYALTGDARRTREDYRARDIWVGGNRDRRTVYERD